ncbi:MAG: MerR family transcriptional regulator [Heliobacteriaceae bacterium]|jgi:predicted HicB family RNase H-like nuclease|nr:MerR family transcriptional regulator [Heliobacteriaceae bacterium]
MTTNEKILSPQEVRKILNIDNREIVELCKKASIAPKKNDKGQTYFSYDEVKNLRRIQKNQTAVIPQEKVSALTGILNAIKAMETSLNNNISKVLDEKLEGMDEVVVELIRCKTDNESLRQKIVNLNKDIYQLKNELSCYKPVALGLYKKKQKYIWE